MNVSGGGDSATDTGTEMPEWQKAKDALDKIQATLKPPMTYSSNGNGNMEPQNYQDKDGSSDNHNSLQNGYKFNPRFPPPSINGYNFRHQSRPPMNSFGDAGYGYHQPQFNGGWYTNPAHPLPPPNYGYNQSRYVP